MSIQSEIDRLRGAIGSAYAAVEEKGGTLPETQNSAGLAEAVRSIPEQEVKSITQEQADERYLKLEGGAMTGPLTVLEPVEALHAVNKKYVDERIAAKLDAIRISMSHELGSKVNWAGHQWIVVHAGQDTVVLARDELCDLCYFGEKSRYDGSNLAKYTRSFEDALPAAALEDAVETTVNGVTGKIFAASYEQVNGGFSYFDSDERRVCCLDLSLLGEEGKAAFSWWTSSPYDYEAGLIDDEAFYVESDGTIDKWAKSRISKGFRPFVALRI